MSRNELIKLYFMDEFKYTEIILLLVCRHRIRISVRHLKRILSNLGLRRRHLHFSSIRDVVNTIRQEASVSGQCIGYRSM